MIYKNKPNSIIFGSVLAAIFLLSSFSCAPVPPKQDPAKEADAGLPVISVPQTISSASAAKLASLSFLPLYEDSSAGLLWWNLSEKNSVNWSSVFSLRTRLHENPLKDSVMTKPVSELRDGKFLFGSNQQHGISKVLPRNVKGQSVYHPYDSDDWTNPLQIVLLVFSGLILLLLSSLVWRGFALVNLFFSLWKKRKREELFGKSLIGRSSLVPPVSLFLYFKGEGLSLLNQISSVEKLDYEEVELIVFRDMRFKDEDALLLKDFRLRYRSPLYFSDLEFEEPFEILEVQGGRRILLVYSKNHKIETSFVLFLKLARYPLTGMLHENTKLHAQALSKLVYRWLLEGEKQACVFGFLEDADKNPFSAPVKLMARQGIFLNILSSNSLKSWIEGDSVFCLIPKYIAILYADESNGRLNTPFVWRDISSNEIVGTNQNRGRSALDDVKGFLELYLNALRHLRLSFASGFSGNNIKRFLSRLSWIVSVSIWPLVIIGYFSILWLGLNQVQNFAMSLLFLAGTELVLTSWGAVIWSLFSENKIQMVLPLHPVVQLREKPEMSV